MVVTASDLGLDLSKPNSLGDATVHKIQDHILKLKGQNIPYGLHTFGRTPDKAMRDSTVDAIVSIDRRLLPNDAKVLASDMDARVNGEGEGVIQELMSGVGGRWVSTRVDRGGRRNNET